MRNKQYSLLVFTVTAALLVTSNNAFAWDPVRDLTGRNLTNLLKDKLVKTRQAAGKFVNNPIEYALHLPASVFADVCSAPVQWYGGTLAGQANGKWKELPPELLQAIQSEYSNNLTAVRYAEGIGTVNASGQTFGNLIYLRQTLDLSNPDDMHLLLHELEHTSQYARASGEAIRLCEYMGKSVGSGFRHDNIDWERAADRKADSLLGTAMQAMYRSTIGPNSILVANDTDIAVTFDLQTANVEWTQFTLPPHTQDIFDTDKPESWFNIRVITPGRYEANYGVDAGSSNRIFWTNQRYLDVVPM